ncbi:CBS domain-containing protein [Parvularcula oceani]|uniref:CBS domain-containing protein n=1 Tax=Parvularcula oceani TaxID=1247963 RepID=UPI0004E13793|nr:CBS domain-containing protein [Parvularcula oceani]
MKAKDILERKGRQVLGVEADDRLDDAIALLANKNIGAVVVRRGDALAGILSERDIVRALAGAPTGFRETKVEALMTTDLFTASPEASVDELLDLMTERRVRHVPILEGETLSGILSIGDVVKHRIREVEDEAKALKSYISSS